jgi:copper oxidase (laccase) domain-containing protein
MSTPNPAFRVLEGADRCLLQESTLLARGVTHAFCGRGYNARVSDLATLENQLGAFGVRRLLLPEQVHGTTIWDLRAERSFTSGSLPSVVKADAIVAPRQAPGEVSVVNSGIAIAIRTADCLPILLVGNKSVALVHAGWRGLAAGIVQACIRQLSGEELDARIGPCAGGELYEVGPEVIAAFGSAGCVQRSTARAAFLDLAGTAARIISAYAQVRSCVASQVCTLSDARFYSHRRQGVDAGRNLSWVLTGLG